jgi:D-3-phosphoglycerate dehydrogenase
MPKVLICDHISPLAADVFSERGIEVDVRPGLSPEEIRACIGSYDGLVVRSATRVTGELLETARGLKVIGRAGIGTDNIDVAAATARGIAVMNTPFGNAITTAEHTIAMLLALARQIPQANASTHAGKWEKSRLMGVELTGKTLGIIGCGNVGSIVADRAQALKMKAIAFDPYLSPERAEELGVEKVDLDALLARSDFVTLHTPLNDSTRGLINAATIAKMKKGVRIINCARGGLVVEEDLKAAIEAGHVAGAALDVFAEEPARANVLFGMEQVVVTPHLGGSTAEAQEKIAAQVAEQVADYLLTGAVVNAVNMPSVSAEELPRLRPYMRLAGQIGSFAGQVTETGLKAVEIEYQGHASELPIKPLTAVVLQGLLAPLLESVNMVNAPVIAKERGIDITEVRHERASAYNTLIKLTVTTETQTRSLAGTLFNGDEPRIVEIKGIRMDAKLGSHMLYTTNRDKPGFIGALGTALGEAGINIATFSLGRDELGGNAIALIEVDQPVTPELVERVSALPLVIQVKALKF